MIKLIEKIFGIKIIKRSRYDMIINRIAECGNIYRKHSGQCYHHGDAEASIPLVDLSHICTVENLVWLDVNPLLNNEK